MVFSYIMMTEDLETKGVHGCVLKEQKSENKRWGLGSTSVEGFNRLTKP